MRSRPKGPTRSPACISSGCRKTETQPSPSCSAADAASQSSALIRGESRAPAREGISIEKRALQVLLGCGPARAFLANLSPRNVGEVVTKRLRAARSLPRSRKIHKQYQYIAALVRLP